MELDDAKFMVGLESIRAVQDCGAHGAHLRGFLFFMFSLFCRTFTASSAIDLAIVLFSGHDGQNSTNTQTVCFLKLFFGYLLVIHFLDTPPRPLPRVFSS